MTAVRRFAGEIGAAFLGFVAIVAAVALLVDGVEQARALALGDIPLDAWALWVLARWPGRVASMLPVAATLATALVTSRWQARGWLDALEGAGVRPVRLAAAAGLVGAIGVCGLSAVREAVASEAVAIIAPRGTWIAVDRGTDRWMVRADSLDGAVLGGIRGGRVASAGEVGPFRADIAVFSSPGWTVSGAEGLSADVIAAALPDPSEWRALAAGAGPDAPVRALWSARGTPPGLAWLLETAVRVAYGSGLSVVAVWLARQDRGGAAVVAIAVGWRVLQSAAIAAAAGGAWSVSTAGWVPFVAVVAAISVSCRFGRGRSFPTG
jgi:hypothetical protein